MGSYDVICIGGATLDTFLTISETNPKCRLDPTTKELCFLHGEKISVAHTYYSVGGNGANVTVGLARLGVKATIAAEIGDDEFALKIINTFAKEHIDRGFVRQMKGQESSMSVIINFKGDRTIFSEHVKRDHEFFYDTATTKWVYLTSLGEEWTGAYEKATEYITKNNIHLAFNPGTLQLAKKSPTVDKALEATDILFVNKQEAQQLIAEYAGGQAPEDIEEILEQVKALGPQAVVITDGKNGSYALDSENHFFHQDNFPATIVERTGAGDAYAAGFLAATVTGKDVAEAMKWGSINASSVIEHIGAEAGLLKKEEMEEKAHGFR